MGRILHSPIRVELEGSLPIGFTWRGNYYSIENILDFWKDAGSWWQGEGTKIFYRVALWQQGIFELYFDTKEKNWFIYKIYD